MNDWKKLTSAEFEEKFLDIKTKILAFYRPQPLNNPFSSAVHEKLSIRKESIFLNM
jgi:hypothetical protein